MRIKIMRYRLGFPLLIVAMLACIGIASAMGHNVLPDTVLDILNGNSPSKKQAEVANLAKDQPSRQEERRSSDGPSGAAGLPAETFKDFFEVAQAGMLSDMTASLTFPQGGTPVASAALQARGFASGAGNPAHSPQGSPLHSDSFWNPGNGNGNSGIGGMSGLGSASAGSGGSGGGSSPNEAPSQALVLASLMTGLEEGGSDGSANNPASVDDPGLLPQATQIPQPSFVPEADPLMGTPIQKVIPEPSAQPNPEPAPIPNPEPGTLILGGLGMVIMAVAHRRMRSRQGE